MENNKRQDQRKRLAIAHRPLLDNRKKELMMAVLIRNEQAFKAMRDNMAPTDFDDFDQVYGLVWRLTLEFYDTFGVLPDGPQLTAEVEDAYNGAPGSFSNDEQTQMDEFLETAFDDKLFPSDIRSTPKYADWAVKIGQRFLEERLVARTRDGLQVGAMVPSDIPAFLAESQNTANRISSLTSAGPTLAFGDEWDQQVELEITPTGMSFFDDFLGGGDAPGETYGVLGPFGSCKTTLAYMLAVKRAYRFQDLLEKTGEHKMVVVCSYEAPLKEMRQRSIGYAARILRANIEKMKSRMDLSTTGSLLDYERRLFHDWIVSGNPVPGERERADDARRVMDQHMIFLDMTGNEHKGRGGGSFNEAGRWISHELRQRGGHVKVGMAIFDYVGAMIKRFMAAADKDESLLRHLITGAGLEAKAEIGHAYHTPVYLFHQLSGKANELSEGKLADHTESAESKSFAENLDFSFSIGKPNLKNVALFGCTKHRRQGARPHTIIQVDGAMNQVVSADHFFTLDPGTNKIISIEDARTVRGDVKPRTPRTSSDVVEDNPSNPNE